jgi:hypothetical protein
MEYFASLSSKEEPDTVKCEECGGCGYHEGPWPGDYRNCSACNGTGIAAAPVVEEGEEDFPGYTSIHWKHQQELEKKDKRIAELEKQIAEEAEERERLKALLAIQGEPVAGPQTYTSTGKMPQE